MPDAKQSRPAEDKTAKPLVDPRIAAAQQFVNKVVDRAKSERAEQKAVPAPSRGVAKRKRTSAAFSFSIAPASFAHLILAAIALTFAGVASLWCYAVLCVDVTAGRTIALPLGVVIAAVLSYLSVLFLAVIETTSLGRTNVESIYGDWREWFWTLPASLGMLAAAAFIGWMISVVLSANVWFMIALSALLLYPILQLSSLETGSPLAPVSLPVLESLIKHPAGWFVFYAISIAGANLLWQAARWAWYDPPYITAVIMGPIVTVALFFYAWLLGQLAHLISKEKET